MLLVLLASFKPIFQQIRLLQVAKICWRKSVEISYTFLQQNLFVLRVLPTQGKPVLQEVTELPCMAWLPRNFIQSKLSIRATCNNLICCKIGLIPEW